MKQRWVFVAVFASFAFCGATLAGTPVAEAATIRFEAKTEVTNPVAAATVNLYCNFRSENKRIIATGSGVFVHERGVILTNAHVGQHFLLPRKDGKLKGSCKVRTGSPAKSQYSADVLYIPSGWFTSNLTSSVGNGENDFALLYVTDRENGIFPALPLGFASALVVNEPVSIAGYPSTNLNQSAIRNKLKVVSASSTIVSLRNFGPAPTADILTIASSPASAAGMSGGPVTNAKGEVIGLATAISTSDTPTLRAITLSYINRTTQTESQLPLPFFFIILDFKKHAVDFRATISSFALKKLEDSLLKKE